MAFTLPYLLLLLGLAPGAARALPLSPTLLPIPEARGGIPAQSCAEALALAAEDRDTREPIEQPTTTAPVPSQGGGRANSPEKLPLARLIAGPDPAQRARLPGAIPELLPLQPLEGSPQALVAVGGVMQRAASGGRVRISVFGASHTAGDYWTGHLRRLLQRRYGDLGHGFFWPADLVPQSRASDLNLCRTKGWRADYVGHKKSRGDGLYGFAGGSVSSADPADFGWMETTHDNPEGRRVSQVDLFTLGQPAGGTLLVTVDDAPPRAIPTQQIALGLLWHRLVLPDGPHRVSVQPLGDGEVRIFGMSAERAGPGVIVDAIGINGRQARTWLEWEPQMAALGLAALGPDLVVLAYGTNEANDTDYHPEDYRRELRAVLTQMRASAPDAACILVGPTDRARELGKDTFGVWPRTAPVTQVQREVAPEFGCASWDWQAAMGGPGSAVGWRLHSPPFMAGDLVHLTEAGYTYSAERFLFALEAAAGWIR
jgi:lysophospholipase L1-like esterase